MSGRARAQCDACAGDGLVGYWLRPQYLYFKESGAAAQPPPTSAATPSRGARGAGAPRRKRTFGPKTARFLQQKTAQRARAGCFRPSRRTRHCQFGERSAKSSGGKAASEGGRRNLLRCESARFDEAPALVFARPAHRAAPLSPFIVEINTNPTENAVRAAQGAYAVAKRFARRCRALSPRRRQPPRSWSPRGASRPHSLAQNAAIWLTCDLLCNTARAERETVSKHSGVGPAQ